MSDSDKIVELLERVPLFAGLKKRQLATLANIFIDRKCEPGEVIVPQGRGGYGFFIIMKGTAEAVLERPDGTKVVVNTFKPLDFFGELSLLDGGPRTATVQAIEECECLILPRENFIGTLRRDGEMAVAIMEEVVKRFRQALNTL